MRKNPVLFACWCACYLACLRPCLFLCLFSSNGAFEYIFKSNLVHIIVFKSSSTQDWEPCGFLA